MNMLLQRERSSAKATIGKLYVDGIAQCVTLEDVVRPVKIPGETAIPAGKYRVIINRSTRFKRDMPLLLNVQGFSGIRIHPGNTAANTEGCILVGMERVGKDFIGQSRVAYDQLFAEMKEALANGEEIWLEITEKMEIDIGGKK